ncbi:MAG TPA: hypothetical protein VFF36_06600, partial [Planctomycetota bacterium]|nr:hypothetical protein [Planctomycetota bacterium]
MSGGHPGLAALGRRPLALLPALGGALLMLGVLGSNLRGAAAAVLAAAGAPRRFDPSTPSI